MTISETREEIGKRIRKRRRELSMTQSDLAERTGYSDVSSISKIEKGTADIPQKKIALCADALHTSIGYLLDLDSTHSALAEIVREHFGSVDFSEAEKKDIIAYIQLVINRRGL